MTTRARSFRLPLSAGLLPALAAGWLAVGAAQAGAFPIPPPPPPSCLGTFGSAGSRVTCQVPPGITKLHILATGGWGGNGGGEPGVVQADLPVSAGDDLSLRVGGDGGTPAGGFNGGGNGAPSAGGGGGASDVRKGGDALANRVIVAAGGGGAGQALNGDAGGHGGGAFLTAEGGSGGSVGDGGGGTGGTQTAPGAGGSDCPVLSAPGEAGGSGNGGDGGTWFSVPLFPAGAGGGGGGGGVFGGGGGGGDCGPGGGGGAGSSTWPQNMGGVVVPPRGVLEIPGQPQIGISAPVPTAGATRPSIGGAAQVGQTLTEGHGAWTNGPIIAFEFQWSRCAPNGGSCSPIPLATGQSYVVTGADIGSSIVVAETATNSYGDSSPASAGATATVASGVPINTAPPTIDGSPVEGHQLTEVDGTWTNSPSGHVRQWARCDGSGHHCVPIAGATGQTYVPGPADVGSTIAVSDTASNGAGSAPAPVSSAPTAPVASGVPVDIAAPTLVGAAVQGQSLSVQRGVWSNNPTDFQYEWARCDAAGACQPIPGNAGMTYALSAADIGQRIRVQETAENAFGASTPVASVLTGTVTHPAVSVQAFALVGTARSIIPGPVASFSDPAASQTGTAGDTATVAWGDGAHGTATITRDAMDAYLVMAQHQYAKPGNYTLTVRVGADGGTTAAGNNRVSVFAAAVCPKRSMAHGHNCLGDLSLPAGCIRAGASLHVAIPGARNIAGVRYRVDGHGPLIAGRGREFAAAIAGTGLSSGRHHLTAMLRFRSGRPRTMTKTRTFAVC